MTLDNMAQPEDIKQKDSFGEEKQHHKSGRGALALAQRGSKWVSGQK